MTKARREHARLTRYQPGFESLERRDLLSWSPQLVDYSEVEPNDVITQAQELGPVDFGQGVRIRGAIAAGADVDFYRFEADEAQNITLTLAGPSIVSLYENDPLATPLGHPLILQFASDGAAIARSINLLPGTYEVAVSGRGDRYFSPVLADSGIDSGHGPYTLIITGDNPDYDSTVPVPIVRTDLPAGGYTAAPLAIHLTLTQPLDLNADYVTILDSQQNDLSPTVTFHPAVNELIITPASALDVGQYQIVGYDANGNQILTLPFSVIGRKGHSASAPINDTLATATPLSDITNAGVVQAAGAIGTDPYYNPANSDPAGLSPSNQVDMYRFTVSGSGRYVLTAEAFAGRIGSPLDAALTLFRVTGTNPDGSPSWQLVAGNDNQYNPTIATDGEVPLYTDPALFTPLSAGRYVIVVSASDNYADPLLGMQPGTDGIFNPNVSHSGIAQKATTGAYVLNLLVQPAQATPPQVTQTSVAPGAVLTRPPTQFTVHFSTPVNLVQLAVLSGQQWQLNTFSGNVDAALLQRFPVFVGDAAGQHHVLALASYDGATGIATFTALDRLTDGDYTLHLSGPDGLSDFGGNPLAGNNPSGDYVVPFTVTGSPPRPALLAPNPDDSLAAPTDLGALFTSELAAGLNIRRDFRDGTPPQEQADYYTISLLQDTGLILSLTGPDLTVAGRPVLLNADGNPAYPAIDPEHPGQHEVNLVLRAGTYTIEVGGWSVAGAAQAVYTLNIVRAGFQENPTPLTTGPAPALRLRLDSVAPTTAAPVAPAAPSSPAPAPQLTLPSTGTPSITLTVDRSAASTALPGTTTLPGAAAGLAAGPVGVVGNVSASTGDAPRLVLPGIDAPPTTVAAVEGPSAVSTNGSGPIGLISTAVEGTLRALLIYSIDWLRVPPLMPRLQFLEPEPAPVEESADTDDAAPVGDEVNAAAREMPSAVWAAALALAGQAVREESAADAPRRQRRQRGRPSADPQ